MPRVKTVWVDMVARSESSPGEELIEFRQGNQRTLLLGVES